MDDTVDDAVMGSGGRSFDRADRPASSTDEYRHDMANIEGLDDLVEIGRGGFGVVYRATERELGRTVAVKVLPPLRDEAARMRFDRERLALGSMSGHPNIVVVHRSGSTQHEEPFLVMEFCDQGSVGDQLEYNGPLPVGRATDVAVKMAGALETAHRNGIVHRDIKPANILLSGLNEPKLADFGIARVDGAPETQSSTVTASLAHAAPEVINGGRPDARSDVYSLASTLYELIVGSAAFVRPGDTTFSIMGRIAAEPVPTIPADRAPHPVAQVVAWGMAKSPEHRPGSAHAFGGALADAQRGSGLPVTALQVEGMVQPQASPDFQFTQAVDPPLPLPVPAAPIPATAQIDHVDRTATAGASGSSGSRLALVGVATVLAAIVGVGGYALFRSDGADQAIDDEGASVDVPLEEPDSPSSTQGTPTSSTPETPIVPADQDPLTLGTLLPTTGQLAFFGPTTQAGAELAVADINAAGGVLGQPVELVPGDSADDSGQTLDREAERLAAASVDAVVGPFTSAASTHLLENPPPAPFVMISPSATSTRLTDLDTDNRFFRTSPSETTQGTIMAQVLSDLGIERLALVHRDEAYGQGLSDNIRQRYAQLGGVVVLTTAYDPLGDVGPVVDDLLANPADGIVIIGFEETTDIYAALTGAGIGPLGDGTPIFGVDANAILLGDPATIDGYRSILPRVDLRPLALFTNRMDALGLSGDSDYPYAPESYDAAVIAALAAEAAGATDSDSVAAALVGVTKDGEKCFDFAECKRMLSEGLDIDYDGLAGPYELTPDGDPRVASYVILTYDGGERANPDLDEFVFSR